MPAVDPRIVVELAVGAAGVGVWFAALWVALLLTRPRPIASGPAGQDFGGDEPPAVVSLITNRWELGEDAAESTLIDLAARRILEFRQPGNEPAQSTVHVREAQPEGLNPYETMIFQRVAGLTVGGTVPLTALTFREQGEATAWTRRLNAAIVADARLRGLSQRRFSPAVVAALVLFAVVPVFAVFLAVLMEAHRRGTTYGDAAGGMIVPVMLMFAVFGSIAGRSRGERDTPHGRVVAARWLGLKRYLRAHESFAELPPAAVTVWDRYLSYGDAVGATHVCSAVIDLGMGNRRRVWSSFGGTWHRVRVRYPSFFPRYGQKAVRLFVKAFAALAVAFLMVRVDSAVLANTPRSATQWVVLAVQILILWPFAYGAYTLLGAIIHVFVPVTVTGEVLWTQVWRSVSGGDNEPSVPVLHHLAVDDGSSDRTVAWACPAELEGKVSVGDVVTFTARRWTRRVITLEVIRSRR